MARRREESILDELSDILERTPSWIGPILAFLAFVLIRWVLPLLIPPKTTGIDASLVFRPLLPLLSWVAGFAVFIAWVAAELHKMKSRRLFDRQTSIETVRSLSWSEFENLIAEYYRRHGYQAQVVGSACGDGGVDILLNRRGECVLVQCKQWKAWTIPVQPVRELVGVVTAQGASRGILVTSGRFTNDAKQFAAQCDRVELIDGDQLAEMMQIAQATVAPSRTSENGPLPNLPSSPPLCPSCGAAMVIRMARRGSNAGSPFWGCTTYPTCRGTRRHSA
jgi:restriction system protein